MQKIPKDKMPDSSLALLADGYEFITKRCEKYQSDVFETKLLFERRICMKGEEAAKVFYDKELFKREGAAPDKVKKTLFGEGGVQGLDGESHAKRKMMFMSMMSPEGLAKLRSLMEEQWQRHLEKWVKQDEVKLFDEAEDIVFKAVCKWSGIPLKDKEVKKRRKQVGALIEGSGAVGIHLLALRGRSKAEKWISRLVKDIRKGDLNVEENTALHTIAFHKDADGTQLNPRIAAVELLNVIRPTVAVDRYIVFAALALHEYPGYKQRIRKGDDEFVELFVQEVRRYYPFFPFTTAVVKKDFEWKGFKFEKDTNVLLDLYGTNHDARSWENPEKFRPQRFSNWNESPYNFIPQGGGSHEKNHRCPGEWITIDTMKIAVKFLCRKMDYQVPKQDLTVSMSRIPALPASGFIIKNVRPL
ncbi:cytochrome P450 [Cytophagaceae bacterium ABcell3]|nr:cytochrome P450 [Cytophagaceae bacterium ABcell3]